MKSHEDPKKTREKKGDQGSEEQPETKSVSRHEEKTKKSHAEFAEFAERIALKPKPSLIARRPVL